MNSDSIKMILPCACPHCGQPIVLNINQAYPTIDVMSQSDAPEEIKNVIENYDITQAVDTD